jgi:hypothetical protein
MELSETCIQMSDGRRVKTAAFSAQLVLRLELGRCRRSRGCCEPVVGIVPNTQPTQTLSRQTFTALPGRRLSTGP